MHTIPSADQDNVFVDEQEKGGKGGNGMSKDRSFGKCGHSQKDNAQKCATKYGSNAIEGNELKTRRTGRKMF